jgi:hypothetical protein
VLPAGNRNRCARSSKPRVWRSWRASTRAGSGWSFASGATRSCGSRRAPRSSSLSLKAAPVASLSLSTGAYSSPFARSTMPFDAVMELVPEEAMLLLPFRRALFDGVQSLRIGLVLDSHQPSPWSQDRWWSRHHWKMEPRCIIGQSWMICREHRPGSNGMIEKRCPMESPNGFATYWPIFCLFLEAKSSQSRVRKPSAHGILLLTSR